MNRTLEEEKILSVVIKDYSGKVSPLIDTNVIKPSDVNEFISLINYCFHTKNNFFVANFNKKITRNVYTVYNTFKTNILSSNELFTGIDENNLKSIKFVLTNFVNNHEEISKECPLIDEIATKDGIKRFLDFLNAYMKFMFKPNKR